MAKESARELLPVDDEYWNEEEEFQWPSLDLESISKAGLKLALIVSLILYLLFCAYLVVKLS